MGKQKDQLNILIDKIENSDIILVGYSFEFERIKYSLLRHFKSKQIFDIGKFSIKSFNRDRKIDSLFYNKHEEISKYFYCDLAEMKVPLKSDNYYSYSSSVLESLRSEFINTDNKLIITSPVNTNHPATGIGLESSIYNSFSSMLPLAICDLAIVISENKIKVIKDRHSFDKLEIDI